MRQLRPFLLSLILILGLANPALSQYMYLDVDGDAVNTTSDRLSETDSTVITVYLDSSHDKNGSPQSCNSHAAVTCGALQSADELTVFGYTVVLHAEGGNVQWGTFQPDSVSFAQLQPQVQDSTDVEFTFLRPAGTSSPAGLSSLGKISVTIISGSPSVHIATSTSVDPGGFGTGFATYCGGSTYSNTYVLGDPTDPCGTTSGMPGDWFDTDGAGEPEGLVTGPGPGGGGPDSPEQNYPPIFNTHPSTVYAAEGSPFSYGFNVHTSDGDSIVSLTADLSDLPPGNNAAFSTGTETEPGVVYTLGDLTWTPTAADAGTYRVVFTATAHASSKDTIIINVVNGPASAFNLTLHFPGPRYKVVGRFYRATCSPQGQLCEEHVYWSGADGVILIPLNTCTTEGLCSWWDEVIVFFPAETFRAYAVDASFVEETFADPFELHPATNPADRLTSYTVPVHPWVAQSFSYFDRVVDYFASEYGGWANTSPVPIMFRYGNGNVPLYPYGVWGQTIVWPYLPEVMANMSPKPAEWMAAHEFSELVYQRIVGVTGDQCEEDLRIGSLSDCDWFTYPRRATYCARDWNNYDPCQVRRCQRTAWTEGIADALAELYYKRKIDSSGTGVGVQRCPSSALFTPGAVAGFVMAVAGRTPKEFMNRWTGLHFSVEDDPKLSIAMTAYQFLKLWNQQDFELCSRLAFRVGGVPPGSWSINDLYDFWYANGLVTGVEDQAAAPETRTVRVVPNPTSDVLKIAVYGAGVVPAQVQIFDVTGRLALTRLLLSKEGSVSTRDLGSGIYWVRVLSSKSRLVGPPTRVVIIH